MWFILLALAIGLLAFYLFKAKSVGASPQDMQKKYGSSVPNKVLIPSAITNQSNIIAWEFQAPNLSTACEFARNHTSVRKKANECVKLPLTDCSSSSCVCFYRPIYNTRTSQRRNSNDRRESYRFAEINDNRRLSDDRRNGQLDWHDKHIK